MTPYQLEKVLSRDLSNVQYQGRRFRFNGVPLVNKCKFRMHHTFEMKFDTTSNGGFRTTALHLLNHENPFAILGPSAGQQPPGWAFMEAIYQNYIALGVKVEWRLVIPFVESEHPTWEVAAWMEPHIHGTIPTMTLGQVKESKIPYCTLYQRSTETARPVGRWVSSYYSPRKYMERLTDTQTYGEGAIGSTDGVTVPPTDVSLGVWATSIRGDNFTQVGTTLTVEMKLTFYTAFFGLRNDGSQIEN